MYGGGGGGGVPVQRGGRNTRGVGYKRNIAYGAGGGGRGAVPEVWVINGT